MKKHLLLTAASTTSVLALTAFTAFSTSAASAAPMANSSPDTEINAGSTNDALFSIESNRESIVARVMDRLDEAIKQRALSKSAVLSALRGLRADQLLSASLANTLDDVLLIAREPVSDDAATHRYVALVPTAVGGYRAPAEASAFVLRNGAELEFVTAAQLRTMSGSQATIAGYFVPNARRTTSPAAASAATALGIDTQKDGVGTGSSSWIGYTAGGNAATATSSAVAAGSNNLAGGANSFVGAGFANQATGVSSLVIGGFDNRATNTDALVGAGAGNRATGARAIIVGGGYNIASGNFSFIGGGGRDGVANTAAGTDAKDHIVSGDFGTIAGGQGNRVSGLKGFVGGGRNNVVSAEIAVIAGGQNNTASGYQATIAGGQGQVASNNASTIGGGGANTSSGNHSTVAGGLSNTASGDTGVIGGGFSNTVSGGGSVIVGGGGGLVAGGNSFVGHGGSGTASNCYNHVLGTNTSPCWNEIGAAGYNAVIVGGFNNRNNNFASFIGGGASNTITQNDSVIVGGVANLASNYGAFIGGGSLNTARGGSSVVVGGSGNKATAQSSVVVGGGLGAASNCFNFVTSASDRPCWNESNATTSLVGAGADNVIGATVSIGASAIVAGASNRNAGDKSFMGAGVANIIAQDDGLATPTNVNSAVLVGGRFNSVRGFAAALVGGSDNIASGPRAFVGAGRANTASGDRSAIVGGGSTSVTCFNKATSLQDFSCANVSAGQYAFVGAGIANRASGNQAVVSGGVDNDASGFRSAIAGGSANTASGVGSFAAGRANWASGAWSAGMGRGGQTNTGGATPVHHFGAFVWADSPDDGTGATPVATQVFRSTGPNQFAVRARGGVSFKVGAPAIADPTDPGYVSNAADATPGCSLPAGGAASWSCTSDRNTKEAIRAISPKTILAKVTALPLSTWQFKGTDRRHLSPMAQDFWAAFGLGVNDKAITSSDVSGVALGAIQGLNQKLSQQLKQKDSEIATLQREMAAIKKKLGM